MILQFEKLYLQFKKYITEKDGNLHSFHQPYIKSSEAYKYNISHLGYAALSPQNWDEKLIGTGKILEKVKSSINLKINNLLIHDDRRGEKERQDKSLYADYTKTEIYNYEKIIYNFYLNKKTDEESFNQILKISGKIYPFISYLFFLKDSDKYLPIAPKTFDLVFNKMDIPFRTSGKCSWENYLEYLNFLKKSKIYYLYKKNFY